MNKNIPIIGNVFGVADIYSLSVQFTYSAKQMPPDWDVQSADLRELIIVSLPTSLYVTIETQIRHSLFTVVQVIKIINETDILEWSGVQYRKNSAIWNQILLPRVY